MKQLNDSQLENFDIDDVVDKRWEMIKTQIDREFPQGDFTFLDIGGGNGKFSDRLLMHYPKSQGTVLDNSEFLLTKNQTHSRKTLICDSVENLRNLTQKYDLICLNWLLHHLVSDSYNLSRQNISLTLNTLVPLLSERGRVSIFENIYDGLLFDGLPSYLIFHLTSAKGIEKIIKALGANTAGVGVCFLSKQQWLTTIKKANLEVLQYSDDDEWSISQFKKIFLHLGQIRKGHFWLAPLH
jgi:hypothetical protein